MGRIIFLKICSVGADGAMRFNLLEIFLFIEFFITYGSQTPTAPTEQMARIYYSTHLMLLPELSNLAKIEVIF